MINYRWSRGIAATAFGVVTLAAPHFLKAQQEFFTAQDVIKYTPDWKGERFPDGRPKVPEEILDRMKNVTLEEAWATLQQAGFMHQYEDGWLSIHGDKVLVGRALTAVWMPGHPDVEKVIEQQGIEAHRQGTTNAWPVDMLQPRDVYVADHFGLKVDGPPLATMSAMRSMRGPATASSTTARCATLTAWMNSPILFPSSAPTILPTITARSVPARTSNPLW